jgi:hypothetical protein
LTGTNKIKLKKINTFMETSFSRERGLLRQHGRSPGLSFKPSCRAFPSAI